MILNLIKHHIRRLCSYFSVKSYSIYVLNWSYFLGPWQLLFCLFKVNVSWIPWVDFLFLCKLLLCQKFHGRCGLRSLHFILSTWQNWGLGFKVRTYTKYSLVLVNYKIKPVIIHIYIYIDVLVSLSIYLTLDKKIILEPIDVVVWCALSI